MFDISAISNRDLQLLYEYRILRCPADKLTAILGGENFTVSIHEDTQADTDLYTYRLDTIPQPNRVPFLEFVPTSAEDWRALAHLSSADVIDDGIRLYSTAEIPTDMQVHIYWCDSLHQIESLLTDIHNMLSQFDADFDQLKADIEYLKEHAAVDSRPEGLVNNLVKIKRTAKGGNLIDSLYAVLKPEAERSYVNTTQTELDSMLHTFNECIEFQFVDGYDRVMQSWTGPVMKISGKGNLMLRNIKAQVLISGWSGYITVTDCPDVHLQADSDTKVCNIEHLKIMRNSCVYLENYTHYINYLTMLLNSTVRHRRGFVKNIQYVGYGCTYWCADTVWIPGINYFDESDHTQNTVYNFNILDILGTLQHDSNALLIYNTRCIGFKVANADPPSEPRTVQCVWEAEYIGGGGDTPKPITGNSPRSKVYNCLVANTPFSKEVLCGILGNIQIESGFDPFLKDGVIRYGLWMTQDMRVQRVMTENGLGNLWHTSPAWSSWEGHCTEEKWNLAVNLQLQVLVNSHYGGDSWVANFDEHLDKVTDSHGEAGVKSYAELFCAMCIRCTGGTDAITDQVVYDFIMNECYSHADEKYKKLTERRNAAVTIYGEIEGR